MKIQIKDVAVLRQILFHYEKMLVDIVEFVLEDTGEIVITCGYREGDTGVHGTDPCRGIDLRSWMYLWPEVIRDKINEKWIYDPKRPHKMCAVIHEAKPGKGIHLHLQVHPNSKLREKGGEKV